VFEVLRHPDGSNLAAIDKVETGESEPPFRVPPATAIAGVLIRDWAEGKVKFPALPAKQSL